MYAQNASCLFFILILWWGNKNAARVIMTSRMNFKQSMNGWCHSNRFQRQAENSLTRFTLRHFHPRHWFPHRCCLLFSTRPSSPPPPPFLTRPKAEMSTGGTKWSQHEDDRRSEDAHTSPFCCALIICKTISAFQETEVTSKTARKA